MKLTARLKTSPAPAPTQTQSNALFAGTAHLDPHAPSLQTLLAQWCDPKYIRSVETTMDYQSAGMIVRVEYIVPHLALMEIKA